jgi:hypothetical protein
MFKTNHKQLQISSIDFDWNVLSFTRVFGQPSFTPARNYGTDLVARQLRLVGGIRCLLCSILLPVCVTYWVAGLVTLKGSRTSCSTLNCFLTKWICNSDIRRVHVQTGASVGKQKPFEYMHDIVSTNHQQKVSRLLGKPNIRKIQNGVETNFLGHVSDTVLVR